MLLTRIFFTLFLAALLLLEACSNRSNNSPTVSSGSTPNPTPVQTQAAPVAAPENAPTEEQDIATRLGREASEIAESSFKKHIIKCGDSYYWSSYPFSTGGGYLQKESKTEPEFEGLATGGGYIQPKQLSRADELNKVDPQPVEWQGTFSWRINTARIIARGYNDWKDVPYENVTVVRKKGRWYVAPGMSDPTPVYSQSEYLQRTPGYYVDVTCADFVKAKREAGAQD